MKKLVALLTVGLISAGMVLGQTVDELEKLRKAKKDTISRLEKEVKRIDKQIKEFPGWKTGAFGTVGINIAHFSNWFQKEVPNSAGGAIGVTINGYANYDDESIYWRTEGTLNVGWVKFDDRDDPDDENGYQVATDIFNISSLYGRKLTKKLAASARAEYRTAILDNLNNPGYLDLGIGGTLKPADGFYCTFHPVNANLVFADDQTVYESTIGAQIVADYSGELVGGLSFKSKLVGFMSYKDANRSNWTWTSAVSYKLWKIIGLGIEGGLRGNKQETLDFEINTEGNEDATFDTIDNKLQSHFLIGISYKF